MPRRHLCDPLLVPLELKRLGDDEMLRVTLKLCLLEATSSVFCELFAGIRAAMGSFFDEKFTCALPIVSHFWWPTPTTGVGRTAQSDRCRLG